MSLFQRPQFTKLTKNKEIRVGQIFRKPIEANHVGYRKNQTASFVLDNSESLKDDKDYQKTGKYKSKHSHWTFVKAVESNNFNAYRFPDFQGLTKTGWKHGKVEWLVICEVCETILPDDVGVRKCPRCINAELTKRNAIIHT